MNPEEFSTSLFQWEPARGLVQELPGRLLEAVAPVLPPPQPPKAVAFGTRLGGLEDLLGAYGIRYYTAARIAELGFTATTLVDMKEEELDDMMNNLYHIFRWDLLVGERYGIKSAVRAERRRLQEEEEDSYRRRNLLLSGVAGDSATHALDALSQEGLSEEPVQQEKETAGSGGGGAMWNTAAGTRKKQQRRRKKATEVAVEHVDVDDGILDGEEVDDKENGVGTVRQREHPFIVTEPGEVARGKKNGLDYLFHLYEQCREFLIQVQNIAKERGEKCPTKVTNQVFRYAIKSGASYINKPKMRHYVHCYAFHCLDEDASNSLRRSFKERGQNVGAWRQACYKPLVSIAAAHGWDIDAVFNVHPRLSIWYVPSKLRQLCHAEGNNAAAAAGGGASSI